MTAKLVPVAGRCLTVLQPSLMILPSSYIHSFMVLLLYSLTQCPSPPVPWLLPATCPVTFPINEFGRGGNHWNEAHPSLARVIWFLLGGRLNQECQGRFQWDGNNGRSGRSWNVVFNTKTLQQWIRFYLGINATENNVLDLSCWHTNHTVLLLSKEPRCSCFKWEYNGERERESEGVSVVLDFVPNSLSVVLLVICILLAPGIVNWRTQLIGSGE